MHTVFMSAMPSIVRYCGMRPGLQLSLPHCRACRTIPQSFTEEESQRRRRRSGNVTFLLNYFNQPRFLKYQNGVIALATISSNANG